MADPECPKLYELEQDGDGASAWSKSTEFAERMKALGMSLERAAELMLRQHYRLKPHIDVY